MNNVTLVGRLTRDPELKYVGDAQTPVLDFTIAIDRGYKETENNTDFIAIQVWNKTAENCAKYLNKGSLVGINGQIRVEKYKNKNDENRYITKVRASNVEFLGTKRSEDSNKNDKYYDSTKLFEEAGIKTDKEKLELPF
ncbi:single-stranded DNA-binding protein [Romboutsia sp.]|uniref:single-stranded DNA-binding protein n=1 Tax=Romboutsia sp. TaxID=1965302 RepID=UPI003F3C4E57